MVHKKQIRQVAQLLQCGYYHPEKILKHVNFKKDKLDTVMKCLEEMTLNGHVEKTLCCGCDNTTIYILTSEGQKEYGIMGNPWS